MKWYRKLYIGENAGKQKYKIFGKIRKSRFQIDTYLIQIAANPDDLLEIIPANILLQPFYKNKKHLENVYIIGIAKGYNEALELVRMIIDEVYKSTGSFNIKEYLGFGQNIGCR
ncbi:MAG: hypothetical protein Q4F11_01790 [Eubacteriales bacterium]|nr:hypothetical protein [Eubacteriales bacterium]